MTMLIEMLPIGNHSLPIAEGDVRRSQILSGMGKRRVRVRKLLVYVAN